MTFSWAASTDNSGIAGYNVYRDGAFIAFTSSLTYTMTGLTAGRGYVISLRAKDTVGNLSTESSRSFVIPWVPPDPALLAPPNDPTISTDLSLSAAFLYTGPTPIQTDVTVSALVEQRAALLRGRVVDPSGTALSAVMVTVLDHPEFGRTFTRADGQWDLLVNGGGPLTLVFENDGLLPAQRQVVPEWKGYHRVPDVALVTLDSAVTTITNAGSVLQVARGSTQTDSSGTRRATLMFPAGTTATLVYPDGNTAQPAALGVRATEFTVGTSGPQAMPASLPTGSAYTYAVELSVDDAINEGATRVNFSQPVVLHLENFLGFAVGSAVPIGHYDRVLGAWVASENGRVIKIVSITSGRAEVDTDGDGLADGAAALAALAISDAERDQLGSLYSVGQTLWRSRVTHFTPWDCNWPYGPPPDAEAPRLPAPRQQPIEKEPCEVDGSIIECESQVLGETLPLAGVPYALHYSSSRAPGRKVSLDTAVTGATVPPGVIRVELEAVAGGKRFFQTFSAAPNQRYTFEWDATDLYGRPMLGTQLVDLIISYVYGPVRYQSPGDFVNSFARLSGVDLTIVGRQEFKLSQRLKAQVSVLPGAAVGLGGWTLGVHHAYDPLGGTLHLGTGRRRSAANIATTLKDLELQPASYVDATKLGIATEAGGGVLVHANTQVLRLTPTGAVQVVAGNGSGAGCPIGTGFNAPSVGILGSSPMAVGPDGSIYLACGGGRWINRITPDGQMSTIAGAASGIGDCIDGPAVNARFERIRAMTVGRDGTVFLAEHDFNVGNRMVRAIGTDGMISRVAGTCGAPDSSTGDDGPARSAQLARPSSLAIGADGSLFIAEELGHRVRRVGPDGIIHPFADSISYPTAVTVDEEGAVFINSDGDARVLRVGTDGVVSTVAGNGSIWDASKPTSGPAVATRTRIVRALAVARGILYLGDSKFNGSNAVIWPRKVAPTLPGIAFGESVVPSADGSELYFFDVRGKHLKTVGALKGELRYQFGYSPAGWLTSVTDGDGNSTTVERDGSGKATAIVAPFGQRTTLTLDANSYLSRLTSPDGESWSPSHTSNGLLVGLVDPRDGGHIFTYDTKGLLTRDDDPAGGYKTLSRVKDDAGYRVDVTTALGRLTKHRVDNLAGGEQRRTHTTPSGLATVVEKRADESEVVTSPDGTTVTTILSSDPRWYMEAPVSSQVTRLPSGLTRSVVESRTASFNPNNLLELYSLREDVTINGRTFSSLYNATASTMTLTTPAGRQILYTLDAKGRVTDAAMSGLTAVSRAYDTRGRLSTVTQSPRSTTFGYHATSGFLSSITDSLSQVTALTRDPVGRPTRVTRPDTHFVDLGWDENSNLVSVTPPSRPAHTFSFTPADLTSGYFPPSVDGGVVSTSHAFNLDRQPTTTTRPDSATIAATYDSAGRFSTLSYPAATHVAAYHATTGALTSITTGSDALAYGWDGPLPLSEGWSGTVVGTVSRTFDSSFRLATVSVNGASAQSYTWDDDDLLTGVGALTLSRNTANGLLTGTSVGVVADTRGYNGFAEPTSFSATQSGSPLLSQTLTRDDLGRITHKVETIGGVTTTYGYSFDSADRIYEVTIDGTLASRSLYDANGNRTSYLNGGITTTATFDDQDALLTRGTFTYAWSRHGELESKTDSATSQTTSFLYDALGALRSATLPAGTVLDYVIDGRSRRVGKKRNGVLEQGFLYDGQLRIVAELNGSNAVVSRFVYGTLPHSPDLVIKGGVTYRVVHDHLGSVRLVVNTATGVVAQRLDYDEWGRVTNDTNPSFQPFGFAGGLYDRDLNLVRFGARDYDPVAGRWTNKDPIRFRGGDANLYAYATNNPIQFTDTNGLSVQNTSEDGVWIVGEQGETYFLAPGDTYYGTQDGVFSGVGGIHKTNNGVDAVVNPDGTVSTFGGEQNANAAQNVGDRGWAGYMPAVVGDYLGGPKPDAFLKRHPDWPRNPGKNRTGGSVCGG